MTRARSDSAETETWNRFARSYDACLALVGSRYPDVIQRLRRDTAGARRVLEVAAGTGLITLELARWVPDLVATDFSPKMLEILKVKLGERAATGVEVLEQDAEALAFADASFDAVVCVNGLHVMTNPDRALGEMQRVLRPDGVLAVSTFCHGQHALARTISRLMSLVSRFRAHTRFSRQSLARFIEQHGFRIERLEDLGGPVPLVYMAAKKI